MSEQKMNYMTALDQWSEVNVIGPLFNSALEYNAEQTSDWETTVEQVKKAIRAKTLESYKNGLAAQPKQARGGFKPRAR